MIFTIESISKVQSLFYPANVRVNLPRIHISNAICRKISIFSASQQQRTILEC